MGVPTPNVGVTMLVVDLARLLRRNFEAELSKVDTGLTAGEARTLFYVWRLPGQRQAVLADAMYVEPMTLVGYLDTLEKAGLIRRCQDPNDRRAKIIELTPSADPLLEKIGTALQEVRSRALEDIPADQRQILESLLQTMKDSLLQEFQRETEMTADSSIMSARRTSLLGAGLVAIGPISMALYTPAMPALVEAFGTTDSAVKLTLTAYFAGFAVTQLVCGPLTDAFGRKPVTIAFLVLYLVSSVLATFAPTVEFMVFARALQGVGAAVASRCRAPSSATSLPARPLPGS